MGQVSPIRSSYNNEDPHPGIFSKKFKGTPNEKGSNKKPLSQRRASNSNSKNQ